MMRNCESTFLIFWVIICRVTDRLDELNYLAVSSEVFAGLCRSHPVILQPLKNVQSHLKSYFYISKDFWKNQTESRGRMTDRE